MLTKRGVQVFGTRSPERWLHAGPELSQVAFLNNWQQAWVTRGNMDGDPLVGHIVHDAMHPCGGLQKRLGETAGRLLGHGQSSSLVMD